MDTTHAHHAMDTGSSGLSGLLRDVFLGSWYMPHGHCYQWKPGLVWLHVLSDTLIGAAYVLISLILYALVRRIRLPFSTVIVAFGVFIGACGLTHFMAVWNVWNSAYWLAGWIKALTAVASVLTGAFLVRLRPQVVEVASAARMSEERRIQLESKNRELETLYARLKEAEEHRTRFFANVSHELRTPLALILGPVERLLGQPGLEAGHRRDLETVARNGQLLLKQVNELLDAAKLEAGGQEARYTEADLTGLVRLSAGYFVSVGAELRIALEVDAPERLPAQVDVEKLQRVLINLLSNALKFVPAGGQVRLTLRQEGERALLTVDDTGPGVRPELRTLIFERFRQGDSGDTRRFGGTGLGLSIAKDFVELHGGTLTVGDAPGGGARFTVSLPLRAPEGARVHSSLSGSELAAVAEMARPNVEGLRAPQAEDTGPVGSSASPLALVVEDNPEMRQFIKETLSAEFRVMSATDGREGLEQARALRPDVVITDMMMPVMSGDQLVRELRADKALESIPILLLTARADDASRIQLLREGAQDYLTKPFLAQELRARAHNLASARRAREVLQQSLAARGGSLEELAGELAVRKRQLEAALEAASLAREQAEKASQVKSTFLRLVSHELRTPLTAIQLHLQLLLKQGDPQGVVTRISRSFKRLNQLIETVLEYTRVESHQIVARIELFDAGALVQESVEELLPHAQQKLLRLELLAVPPELPPLRSDPRLIRLVLINLVMNAVKYTEQGTIQVSVSYAAGEHLLAVKDTGPGIPPELQARIFEPFEQAEPISRKHTPGVGLGLALVRQLVAILGGRVELQSTVGQGSTFTVVLPPPRE